jgi:hypothetical protein
MLPVTCTECLDDVDPEEDGVQLVAGKPVCSLCRRAHLSNAFSAEIDSLLDESSLGTHNARALSQRDLHTPPAEAAPE